MMAEDIYEKLSGYLDQLPAGFPGTDSGVELRILRQLFTPEDARLAMHISLIPEDSRVIAYRAGMTLEETERRLQEMDRKGLIYSVQHEGKPMRYRIQQFVVGFWEGQVNYLTPGLVRDFEEYFPAFVNLDLWQKVPQLRTIPVEKSVDASTLILPYEQVRELINKYTEFAVVNCICRQEKRILGKACKKPEETCLSFGRAAERNIRINRGRSLSRSEVYDILHRAEEHGLVLQTANARDAFYICTCCGCCCGVLRSLKRDPRPANRASSPFKAEIYSDNCSGCGTCLDRCQMEALSLADGKVNLNPDRCIGCGLCITTCPTGSLLLQRKPESEQHYVPVSLTETYIKLGKARGKMSYQHLIGLKIKSLKDRVLSR